MFKKILVTFLLLGLAANALAANHRGQTHYQAQSPVSHPYKGEIVGSYKGEIVSKPLPPPVPDFVPCKTPTFVPGPYLGGEINLANNYNRTASVYRTTQLTLFGGYSMLNNDFYLAAEIFAEDGVTVQNYRNDVNVNGNPIGLKTTWGFGLSVLPGYILTDSLLGYLRIGAIKTHFQDLAQTATGGQAGIGLECTVNDNWDVRAEYSYQFYQSMSGVGSPRSDRFHLGVLYKFWG